MGRSRRSVASASLDFTSAAVPIRTPAACAPSGRRPAMPWRRFWMVPTSQISARGTGSIKARRRNSPRRSWQNQLRKNRRSPCCGELPMRNIMRPETQRHRIAKWAILALSLAGLTNLAAGCTPSGSAHNASGKPVLRLAYFPNVTHAPALAGVARGDFQQALGDKAALETRVVNAGPEAMEALLANAIDVSYVGPSPAINTYLKSQGRVLRLLAGACSGGASLVASADTPIHSIKDLDGKSVAVPQFGGTQDVSCRHFLAASGLRPKDKGGSVDLQEIKNPDILALFKQKQLDAAWVPEPWAARLIADARSEE